MTDEPVIATSTPLTDESAEPQAQVTSIAASQPATTSSATTPNAALKPTSRHRLRFALLYVGLAAVLTASVVGAIVIGVKPGHHSSGPWSTWKPSSGSTSSLASQIAAHVAPEYKLNAKGSQLVAIVANAPQITSGTHKVLVSEIAIRKVANSNAGISVVSSSGSWVFQFCGLGANCSIASGQASETRGRLVRREALEVALYAFKYTALNTVIAYMPPPPGSTSSTLLYLDRSNFKQQLSQPLSKTLMAKAPLPTAMDTKEAATIDKLTLPTIYSYGYQALQDQSAVLILDPVKA